MKFLMKVGDELDLNVSYDGGAVDGVGYEVPVVCADIISVDTAGIVEALALGEGVVNVTSAGAVIGSIVFSVLSQADYDAQQAIRGGDKELVIGVDGVPVAPILINASQDGYGIADSIQFGEGTIDGAFNGSPSDGIWVSTQLQSGNINAWIGRVFPVATRIKRARVMFHTGPTQVVFQYAASQQGPWFDIGAPVNVGQYETYTGSHPNYVTTSKTWQEYDLSSYPAAFAFRMKCATTTPVPGTIETQFNATDIARLRVWELELYK